MFFKKVFRYLSDKNYRILINSSLGFYKSMDDEKYLKMIYKIKMGKELNLNNPQTYNEKLQWLKIHDRNPLYTRMVDKYSVKEYVKEIIGEEFLIPTYGVWDSFDEIDFAKLPDRFVLKCTHDSGGIVFCKDKSQFDLKKAKKTISHFLNRDFYSKLREWPYKDVKPRIIAEEYMEDAVTGELKDYKFFTFNGKVKSLFVASDRQNKNEETKFDFFDENYNHLTVTNGHPNSSVLPSKPQNFELMKKLAEKLSYGIPHVRVDFYEINGSVYFGEMTFYHHGGIVPFEPEEWDYKFGEWLVLPKEHNC